MNFVVALEGKPEVKVLLTDSGRQRRLVRPFVGARRNGTTEIGIGLLGEGGEIEGFYAPDFFRCVIQSWRGFMILKRVPRIWASTLANCYNAAAPDPTYLEKLGFSSLADQIGWREFESFRRKVVSTTPKDFELDQILRGLKDSGINFDIFELQRELASGRLQPTSYLRALVREEVAAYKQQHAQERDSYLQEIREIKRSLSTL